MSKFWICALSLALALVPATSPAQTTQPAAADDEDVVYRPPSQGASRARMGGGSRTGVKLPAIEALVPDHAGITLSPAPVLYWYCDEPTELPREFSLVDANTLDTVKRHKLTGRIEKGWQKIDLREIGVELSPDTPYEWRIAIVAGTGKASDNAVAGGMIQLARKPQIADAALQPPLKKAAQLAAAGVWYDALAAVMAEVEKDGGNAAAKRALSRLLDQVKLKAATAYAAG
jgi:hypothetical protein